ncbi:hypothetical protein QPK60_21860, partial [Aeromonas caviae]|nr:hypothetical protein [Aeromonas caviae]
KDAINAGRKTVIGMMLLADRHDVISQGQHPELGSALELAMQPTRAYAIAARQALENGAVLMTLLGRE